MRDTKTMTEGAILAAIVTILLLLTLYVPLINTIIMWALPLPFVVFTFRRGLKAGTVLLLVSSFLGFILGGGVLAIIPAIMFGTAGMVIGEIHRRGLSGFAVLLGASLAYIVHILLLFVGMTLLVGQSPMQLAADLTRDQMELVERTLGGMGQMNTEMLDEALDTLLYLAPVAIVFSGILLAIITVLLSYFVLKRLGHDVKKLPPFRHWAFPKSFLWYYLVVLIVALIGVEEGTVMFTVVQNLMMLLGFVLTIQGFAFIFFYCHHKKVSIALPIIIVVASFILLPIIEIIRIVGIIDLGFDLRKRIAGQDNRS
ncbi:YybS family protein [Halalkalibacter sp. APA_J-10(15)]|uniref:YybS family protein n=1 Tax=Halalkalibacter sp. APA_J-10(15) TaxID=2933805 RepID=UPI001FF1BE62|nr:YybS family protein [Halalkalibacter sp. APA_J-10(15)]MCK0469805.1 YybS family protein [Halalkalibacter sp. APA_J-10(15)]